MQNGAFVEEQCTEFIGGKSDCLGGMICRTLDIGCAAQHSSRHMCSTGEPVSSQDGGQLEHCSVDCGIGGVTNNLISRLRHLFVTLLEIHI